MTSFRNGGASALMWQGLRHGGYQKYAAGWKQVVVDLVALGVASGKSP